jgi:acylphosphatase
MIHVLVSGDVQGVGFRQYIRYQARKLNIKGWVKNLPEGKVEAVFTGSSESVEKMIEFSRKGPVLADVNNVEIEELPDLKFDSFEILR